MPPKPRPAAVVPTRRRHGPDRPVSRQWRHPAALPGARASIWRVSESFPELAQAVLEHAQPDRIDIVRAKRHLLGQLGDGQPHPTGTLIASVATLLGAERLGRPQIGLPSRDSVRPLLAPRRLARVRHAAPGLRSALPLGAGKLPRRRRRRGPEHSPPTVRARPRRPRRVLRCNPVDETGKPSAELLRRNQDLHIIFTCLGAMRAQRRRQHEPELEVLSAAHDPSARVLAGTELAGRMGYRRAGAGRSRSVIAATIPVAESNAVTPWSYSTVKVLPLGENRTA